MFSSALEVMFNQGIRNRTAKTLLEVKQELDLSWLNQKDYRIVNTPELLNWAIPHISAARILAVDTETTGLNIYDIPDDDPLKDHIVGMSITWERDQGIYIPFRHALFQNLDIGYTLKKLQPYLETKSIITHNGLFDGKVFYDLGIKLHITQDTLLLYFNLDSTISKGSKGLKALTRRLYGYDVIELSDIFSKESDHGLFMYVEEELCKAYACADSDHTFMVFMDSFSMLLPGQIKSYRLDVRVQNELIRSEYHGKGINSSLMKVLNDVNNNDLQRLKELIFKYVGMRLHYDATGELVETSYTFNPASTDDLNTVFFKLLKYPIPPELQGDTKVSVDKKTLKALQKITSDKPDPVFDYLVKSNILSDVVNHPELGISANNSDAVLEDYSALRSQKCKLAKLVSHYRKLDKLRGSFFLPLITAVNQGRYFSSIKMTRAETARLVDFIQTLDKYLKKLVGPITKDEYLVDFDFAQIEYRVMIGTSNMLALAEILDDPEKDYHREGGSLILAKSPELITGDERSALKAVNFGIPYKMSARGILNNREGIGLTPEQYREKLAYFEHMLVLWDKGLHPIAEMLNSVRRKALVEVPDNMLPPFLRGRKIGRISNLLGRTRIFSLENMTPQRKARIDRQAGNFPIQSLAREIFCNSFCDFCDACKEDGLMDARVPDSTKPLGFRFVNKVKIMAYIHDECLMSIDSTVNPYYIYKLIYKHCMRKIEGHPTYYCGINIISNWYEGKSDKFEAPVRFVAEKVAENPSIYREPAPAEQTRDMVVEELKEYSLRRVKDELFSISPQTADGIFDMAQIIPKFTNYFIRPRTLMYLKSWKKLSKKASDEEFSITSIETFALNQFSNPIFKSMTGKLYTIKRNQDEAYEIVMNKEESSFKQAISLSSDDDDDDDDTDGIEDTPADIMKLNHSETREVSLPDINTNLFASMTQGLSNRYNSDYKPITLGGNMK